MARSGWWSRWKPRAPLIASAWALALVAAGAAAISVRSATPASVAQLTTIDFANVANYSAPPLPAYFDQTVTALDNTPPSNPADDRVATLGRVLFYDMRLSTNDRTSCATCHQQALGFTDSMRQPALLAAGLRLLGAASRQRRSAGQPPVRQRGRIGVERTCGHL
jgi:cytochrome c peroxidase